MKRNLIGLLCIGILLSGCTGGIPQPIQTAPPETQIQDIPFIPFTSPLLDQGIAVGESGNLLYIPCDAAEDMPCPELRLFGDDLLLSAYIRNQYVLRLIRLEDGALLHEYATSASPGVKVCVGNGCIGLLDSGTNRFHLLNEDLTLRSTQPLPTEGDSWYLSPKLDVLYRFYCDKGLLARDLQTGEEHWLVENAVLTKVIGPETEYVLFEYTDAQNQRTYIKSLNLSTGALEPIPGSGSFSTGIRHGDTWLLRKDSINGEYRLSDGTSASAFTWTQSAAALLAPQNHLLLTDQSGRTLQLYDTAGRFVSACKLPDAAYAAVGTDLVWSEYWKGYFFTDTIDGTCRLMFWDIHEATQGADLELMPITPPPNPPRLMADEFYERADALSERFGIRILIAEQCVPEYSHYNAHHLSDPYFVTAALDILEGCMEMYPEGFFRQLPYWVIDHIQIELIGGLALRDGITNQPENTVAFVQECDDSISIVIDGYMFRPETVYHEFSHVIDRRLNWDAFVRQDALYSEAGWLALQPEGFAYASSYTDIPEEIQNYTDSGYFISDYSRTYPTEDRATLIAAAMTQSAMVELNPGLWNKMDYYARCIRDCFDTEGWPDVTTWEEPLQ